MTLDEAIKHCDELTEAHDKLCKRYDDASGYSRSHNEAIRTSDAKKHEKCSQDFRQLTERLKDYKRLKEKDEARMVRYEGDGYADGEMVYDCAFCPNCDHEIEVDSENWGCMFCPECGQRLRWEK